jgi:hypothetical protein
MSNARAMRYRKLALAETDQGKSDLLLKLADECDRGILVTATRHSARPNCSGEKPPHGVQADPGWNPLR